MPKVFLSHTHSDKEIADALSQAIRDLFDKLIDVEYSTKKELGSGIAHGEDWFDWIVKQVTDADVALILLTPGSIQKPWILWEAGAVEGVVMGAAKDGEPNDVARRKVRPLVFHLRPSEIPSPFHGKQARRGDMRQDIELTFEELLTTFQGRIPPAALYQAGRRMKPTIDAYLEQIDKALLRTPLLVSEPAVQEWLERLNDFEERPSEIEQLHRWIKVSFGREDEDQERPLDLRIHRRLAALYSKHGTLDARRRAAEELELARQLAPRDIFILRNLGNAYLEIEAYEEASGIIKEIKKLDADAFERNVECAALQGKWHRRKHDPGTASKVYAAALERNTDSYYLANLAAEAALEAGEMDRAREYYTRSLEILNRLNENNIWAWASAANASIALQKADEAKAYAERIAAEHPNNDELHSIEGGLGLVHSKCNAPAPLLAELRSILYGRVPQ